MLLKSLVQASNLFGNGICNNPDGSDRRSTCGQSSEPEKPSILVGVSSNVVVSRKLDRVDNLSMNFRKVSRGGWPITCTAMKSPIISPKTLDQLSSFFSDCSTLNSISSDFAAAGIKCNEDYEPPTSGQRRYRVSLLYQTLDLTKLEISRDADHLEHGKPII